jgi:hypothetical protein
MKSKLTQLRTSGTNVQQRPRARQPPHILCIGYKLRSLGHTRSDYPRQLKINLSLTALRHFMHMFIPLIFRENVTYPARPNNYKMASRMAAGSPRFRVPSIGSLTNVGRDRPMPPPDRSSVLRQLRSPTRHFLLYLMHTTHAWLLIALAMTDTQG